MLFSSAVSSPRVSFTSGFVLYEARPSSPPPRPAGCHWRVQIGVRGAVGPYRFPGDQPAGTVVRLTVDFDLMAVRLRVGDWGPRPQGIRNTTLSPVGWGGPLPTPPFQLTSEVFECRSKYKVRGSGGLGLWLQLGLGLGLG